MTAGYFSDTWPTFDRQGDHLYFASNRAVSRPLYEDLGGTTFIYTQTDQLYVVSLEGRSSLTPGSQE